MALRHNALAIASFFSFVVLGISTSHGADRNKSDEISKQGASAKMDVIDIVPGRSIGAVALGSPIESLPKGSTVREFDGSYMGISFTHKGGKIDDVWIDDLKKLHHPFRWAGKEVPRHAKLKALKALFGPCQTIPGLKGGMAFKCDSGLTLGCDFHGTGSFVQIRLLPDWGGS
jgi:hypothetical protein